MFHHETWEFLTEEHLLSDEFEPVWRDYMWKVTAAGFGVIGAGAAIAGVGLYLGPAGLPLDALGGAVIMVGWRIVGVGGSMRLVYMADAALDRLDPKATEPTQSITVPVGGEYDFPNGELSQTASVTVASGRGQRDYLCHSNMDGFYCPSIYIPN